MSQEIRIQDPDQSLPQSQTGAELKSRAQEGQSERFRHGFREARGHCQWARGSKKNVRPYFSTGVCQNLANVLFRTALESPMRPVPLIDLRIISKTLDSDLNYRPLGSLESNAPPRQSRADGPGINRRIGRIAASRALAAIF